MHDELAPGTITSGATSSRSYSNQGKKCDSCTKLGSKQSCEPKLLLTRRMYADAWKQHRESPGVTIPAANLARYNSKLMCRSCLNSAIRCEPLWKQNSGLEDANNSKRRNSASVADFDEHCTWFNFFRLCDKTPLDDDPHLRSNTALPRSAKRTKVEADGSQWNSDIRYNPQETFSIVDEIGVVNTARPSSSHSQDAVVINSFEDWVSQFPSGVETSGPAQPDIAIASEPNLQEQLIRESESAYTKMHDKFDIAVPNGSSAPPNSERHSLSPVTLHLLRHNEGLQQLRRSLQVCLSSPLVTRPGYSTDRIQRTNQNRQHHDTAELSAREFAFTNAPDKSQTLDDIDGHVPEVSPVTDFGAHRREAAIVPIVERQPTSEMILACDMPWYDVNQRGQSCSTDADDDVGNNQSTRLTSKPHSNFARIRRNVLRSRQIHHTETGPAGLIQLFNWNRQLDLPVAMPPFFETKYDPLVYAKGIVLGGSYRMLPLGESFWARMPMDQRASAISAILWIGLKYNNEGGQQAVATIQMFLRSSEPALKRHALQTVMQFATAIAAIFDQDQTVAWLEVVWFRFLRAILENSTLYSALARTTTNARSIQFRSDQDTISLAFRQLGLG